MLAWKCSALKHLFCLSQKWTCKLRSGGRRKVPQRWWNVATGERGNQGVFPVPCCFPAKTYFWGPFFWGTASPQQSKVLRPLLPPAAPSRSCDPRPGPYGGQPGPHPLAPPHPLRGARAAPTAVPPCHPAPGGSGARRGGPRQPPECSVCLHAG